mmetsp:Transcript_14911/g.38197  ORF Transcript_14911/g.38197 Transcript_14911/m.38197 type:complete len:303 (-) Transcript_14911:5129-6037(-)
MVSAEQLGELLVVVEDEVGTLVLANHGGGPQLLHEEDLVREVRVARVLGALLRLLEPLGEVPHKVKEEVAFGNRNHLVGDLDKEAHPLDRLEAETSANSLTKVLGAGARVNLKGLVRVVREVHLVKDRDLVVLDGLHLDEVRRVLALSVADRLGKPGLAVGRERLTGRLHPEKHVELLQQRVAAGKATAAKPQEFPSTVLALLVAVVGELLEKLAVHLVPKGLLSQRVLHNSIRQVSALTGLVAVGQVTHVLHDRLVDLHGLVVQVLVRANLLEQRLLDRIATKAPGVERLLPLFAAKGARH